MSLILFYLFASLSVVSAILVISFRNTLSSAIALVVSLFGVVMIYQPSLKFEKTAPPWDIGIPR